MEAQANEGEVVLFCHHVKCLVEQGVDIAEVTPYNLLRLNLRPDFQQLEIKSVDGEGRRRQWLGPMGGGREWLPGGDQCCSDQSQEGLSSDL